MESISITAVARTVLVASVVISPLLAAAQPFTGPNVPDSLSFQGRLADSAGVPLDTTLDVTFKLYHGPTEVWSQTISDVIVSDGLFSVILGGAGSSLSNVSFNESLNLAILVDAEELTPRSPLVPTPYAMAARGFHAIRNSRPGEIGVNVIAGHDNNVIDADAVGGTISGGGGYSGLPPNPAADSVTGSWGTVGGGVSNTAAFGATVGGGRVNKAYGNDAVVGGGTDNFAGDSHATVGGGASNLAQGKASTIGGGHLGTAQDSASTIGGGSHNTAVGVYSTISGGRSNETTGDGGSVGGGLSNLAGPVATVAGGWLNEATMLAGSVGGGLYNMASSSVSTIGGGINNRAEGAASAIAGGDSNWVYANWSSIGGGHHNSALGEASHIGGGYLNGTQGPYSAVAGGRSNGATGPYSFVAGGFGNAALGDKSLAAGWSSVAFHDNSFVWSSSEAQFQTTEPKQFLIDAGGGVGIGTNTTDHDLSIYDVEGDGDAIIQLLADSPEYREMLLGVSQSTGGGIVSVLNNGALFLRTNNLNRVTIDSAGHTRFSGDIWPATDNVYSVGRSGKRWSEIWSANGTIQTSDQRLKRDVQRLDYGLDEVMALRPVQYRWIDQPDRARHLGLIAQETEPIIPEVVVRPESEDEFYSLRYTDLVPVLVAAIQNQESLIEAQQATISDQQARLEIQGADIQALSSRLASLERRLLP